MSTIQKGEIFLILVVIFVAIFVVTEISFYFSDTYTKIYIPEQSNHTDRQGFTCITCHEMGHVVLGHHNLSGYPAILNDRGEYYRINNYSFIGYKSKEQYDSPINIYQFMIILIVGVILVLYLIKPKKPIDTCHYYAKNKCKHDGSICNIGRTERMMCKRNIL